MKRNKHTSGVDNKTVKGETKQSEGDEKSVKIDSLDEEEQGFGGWLRSADGLETMKLFAIANSIVMVTTIVYPHLQTVFAIVYDMIYGPDVLY